MDEFYAYIEKEVIPELKENFEKVKLDDIRMFKQCFCFDEKAHFDVDTGEIYPPTAANMYHATQEAIRSTRHLTLGETIELVRQLKFSMIEYSSGMVNGQFIYNDIKFRWCVYRERECDDNWLRAYKQQNCVLDEYVSSYENLDSWYSLLHAKGEDITIEHDGQKLLNLPYTKCKILFSVMYGYMGKSVRESI